MCSPNLALGLFGNWFGRLRTRSRNVPRYDISRRLLLLFFQSTHCMTTKKCDPKMTSRRVSGHHRWPHGVETRLPSVVELDHRFYATRVCHKSPLRPTLSRRCALRSSWVLKNCSKVYLRVLSSASRLSDRAGASTNCDGGDWLRVRASEVRNDHLSALNTSSWSPRRGCADLGSSRYLYFLV